MCPVSALVRAVFAPVGSETWAWVVSGFVILASAVLCAVVLGLVVRWSALIAGRRLSVGALTRVRLAGAVIGAALGYLFVNFGGGEGWLPGGPGGSAAQVSGSVTAGVTPITPQARPEDSTQAAPAGEAAVLRVRLLGPDSTPPSEKMTGSFFAFDDDPRPKAVNADAVLRRIAELRQARKPVRAVELVITKQSTLLENPVVENLRTRVVREARLPFKQPNPERPFAAGTITFDPPPGGP